MVHQFARKEIADARDRVEGGNYDAAALFVRNAKADIEDYSKIDYGPWKEKFDQLHDDFQEEAEKGTDWDHPDPDKEILIELT